MSYVVAVNRIGLDANGYEYIGHSQVIDMLGDPIVAPFETEGVYVTTVDRENLIGTRAKLNFLNDQDNFEIIN
jgi:predicted amidohydrolase